MKLLKNALFLLLIAANFTATAQINPQDTICLPAARLGRVVDALAYLRQFERYAVISDSMAVECKNLVTALQGQNTAYLGQRDAAVKGGELLTVQLQYQKEISEQWKQAAGAMDIKLQKAKKQGRLFAALFGGAAGAGLSTVHTKNSTNVKEVSYV